MRSHLNVLNSATELTSDKSFEMSFLIRMAAQTVLMKLDGREEFFTVRVEINGHPTEMTVNTACSVTEISATTASEAGLLGHQGLFGSTQVADTRQVKRFLSEAKIALGETTVDALVKVGHINLLGLNALRALGASIDIATDQMTIDPSKAVPSTWEFDAILARLRLTRENLFPLPEVLATERQTGVHVGGTVSSFGLIVE